MNTQNSNQSKLESLNAFALDEMYNNILPYWMNRVKDESTGGYHGAFHTDDSPDLSAERVLILNARLLWTYSSAYRVLGDKAYLEEAWYAYRYFMKYFYDEKNGGFYYSVHPDGSPAQDFKLVYGQAFAIYGLSEFYRVSGHEPALNDAVALYEKLEQVALDPVNGGYWETFSADWSERADAKRSLSHNATKSMNTHLHMIEAYTSLLRVYPTPKMKEDATRHFNIMTKKILNRASGHYYLYLQDNWEHTNLWESYGHDIEGSWLMNECAHVIGDKALIAESKKIATEIAQACMKSIMPDGSMLEEGTPEGTFMHRKRVWWIQAENVVGMLNAWQASGNALFLKTSLNCALYIRSYMSDRVNGEWFGTLDDNKQPGTVHPEKVSGWKCPYHNARMALEIVERYHALKEKGHPVAL